MNGFTVSSVITPMNRVAVVLALLLLAALCMPSGDASAAPLRVTATLRDSGAGSALGQHEPVPGGDASTLIPNAPKCRLANRRTAHPTSGGWLTAVVDTQLALPSAYAPSDLVDTRLAGLNGGYRIRAVVGGDLRAMVHAARRDGVRLAVQSGYRSYAEQAATFAGWTAANGHADALRGSARPGHSEHQLGTAVDFRSVAGPAPWTVADWARTPEGAWLAANGWRFGWVMSYPRGARSESCYDYEPWHYRYVGQSLADAIHAAGVAPRVYLWSLAASDH